MPPKQCVIYGHFKVIELQYVSTEIYRKSRKVLIRPSSSAPSGHPVGGQHDDQGIGCSTLVFF